MRRAKGRKIGGKTQKEKKDRQGERRKKYRKGDQKTRKTHG